MPRVQGTLPRSRAWVVTANNPEVDEREEFFEFGKQHIVYSVHQLERGDSGTIHIQGYCILKKEHDMVWMCKNINDHCRWRIAKGDEKKNLVYCTKPGQLAGPWIYGEVPANFGQGKRSDLLAVKAKLDAGASMAVIAEEHFGSFVRYERAFLSYMNLVQEKRDFKTQVIVLISSPRTGKSTWAKNHTFGVAGKGGFVVYSGQWFNGYNGKDDLIINDFTGWIPWFNLLQLLDAGAWTLETKGGVINCAPRRIVMTSNFIIAQWYEYVKIRADIRALEGRIEYVYDEAIPINVIFFDNAWSDALDPPIANPYPVVAAAVVPDSPGEVAEACEGGFIIPISDADTWDLDDVGHQLNSPYWSQGSYDMEDPHAVAVEATAFFDIECHEDLELDDLLASEDL